MLAYELSALEYPPTPMFCSFRVVLCVGVYGSLFIHVVYLHYQESLGHF